MPADALINIQMTGTGYSSKRGKERQKSTEEKKQNKERMKDSESEERKWTSFGMKKERYAFLHETVLERN